jgi:hypothetical protein
LEQRGAFLRLGDVIMLITSVICWIVVKTKLPGRWLLDNLASLPMVFPGLVLGLALMIFYLNVNVGVYGTIWILFIAYVTRFMPYGLRFNTTSMLQIHKELEESAQTSGASWGTTFRRIILPLLKPGLVAGWIYIVIVSIRELSSSILLYSPAPSHLDHHLGALGERPVRGAVGPRCSLHPDAAGTRLRRADPRQEVRHQGDLAVDRRVLPPTSRRIAPCLKSTRSTPSTRTTGPAGEGCSGRQHRGSRRTLLHLLGPSGCGKTTTLRSIAGLERPKSGRSRSTTSWSIPAPAGTPNVFVPPNQRGFGMVFQSYAIWPHMDVFTNTAFPLQVGKKKYSRSEIDAKVMRVLKAVQLDHLRDREATKLSGGQQQRLALGAALVMEPSSSCSTSRCPTSTPSCAS